MSEQRIRLRIGLFVIAAVTAMAAMILTFGSLPDVFTRYQTYNARFLDATGVSEGTPVRRSGVRIGEVRGIDLDPESGDVIVRLAIRRDYPLRNNERPLLMRTLIGGDTTIDMVSEEPPPGQQADRSVRDPGEELIAITQPNVGLLINQAADMVPTTQETLNEIRKSLARYERIAPLVEETVREFRDLARVVREATPEIRRTNEEIRLLAKSTREAIPDVKKTNDEVQVAVRNWGKLAERVDLAVQTHQDKVVKTVEDIGEAARRTSSLLNDENQRNVTMIIRNIREGTANLPELRRTVESTLKSAEGAMKDVEGLVKDGRQVAQHLDQTLTRGDEVLNNINLATKTLPERLPRTLDLLEDSASRFNRLLAEAGELLRGLSQIDGTVRRFLSDPTLYNALTDTVCMVGKLVPRLDRVLHDVEVFADKIARHPEVLGVGGVVNPSAGLKDAPTSGYFPRRIGP